MADKKNFLSSRIESFKNAFRGIALVFRSEVNARIHALATVLVTITGFFLHLSCAEWLWIASAVVLVLVAEFFNTAIEILCDLIDESYNPKIRNVKDIAAGAVVLCALYAVVVGFVVLGPKIAVLF